LSPDEKLAPEVALNTFDTVWTIVKQTYVDTVFVNGRWKTVRDSLRHQAMAVTTRGGLDRLLTATLAQIPESHFYIIPSAIANEVRADSDPDQAGGTVGLSLRIADGKALAWHVEPGSPAALAGIRAGQVVEQIGDRVVSTSLEKVLSLPDASRQRAFSDLNFKLNRQLTPAVGETVRIRLAGTGSSEHIERQLVAVPMRGTVSKFGNLPRSQALSGSPDSRCARHVVAVSVR
jgi:C-terminal processing protease CtpA/Prc